jgi:O6-methylguanine-DNA--protein-cysteine methyltransferase
MHLMRQINEYFAGARRTFDLELAMPGTDPCHRVIGSDGSLTGFGGGLEAKRRLLELERAQCVAP